MAVYLVDHPPARRQYRSPRREQPSGVCVAHTAESHPDEVGPDDGAENVAAFIQRRTGPGSYHDLADSDSIVQLVRYSDEAFGDATGSNPHAYHVSAATQALRWPTLSDGWVDATVRNMARAAARYARWAKREHGVTIPARRITRAQSERRVPGFISHAERDPARRTDPGKTFPWGTFLAYYSEEMDDMPTLDEIADVFDARLNNAIVKHSDKNVAWHLRHILGAVKAPIRWEDGETRSPAHTLSWLQRAVHTVLQAQEGLDTPAILAKLDEIAAADATRDQAILQAIESIESGDADGALARLRDLLDAALATDA